MVAPKTTVQCSIRIVHLALNLGAYSRSIRRNQKLHVSTGTNRFDVQNLEKLYLVVNAITILAPDEKLWCD